MLAASDGRAAAAAAGADDNRNMDGNVNVATTWN